MCNSILKPVLHERKKTMLTGIDLSFCKIYKVVVLHLEQQHKIYICYVNFKPVLHERKNQLKTRIHLFQEKECVAHRTTTTTAAKRNIDGMYTSSQCCMNEKKNLSCRKIKFVLHIEQQNEGHVCV